MYNEKETINIRLISDISVLYALVLKIVYNFFFFKFNLLKNEREREREREREALKRKDIIVVCKYFFLKFNQLKMTGGEGERERIIEKKGNYSCL